MTQSLPIPGTLRQSVAEEPDFSRTMLPGTAKLGASMYGGEKPQFKQKYYNPSPNKFSRTLVAH